MSILSKCASMDLGHRLFKLCILTSILAALAAFDEAWAEEQSASAALELEGWQLSEQSSVNIHRGFVFVPGYWVQDVHPGIVSELAKARGSSGDAIHQAIENQKFGVAYASVLLPESLEEPLALSITTFASVAEIWASDGGPFRLLGSTGVPTLSIAGEQIASGMHVFPLSNDSKPRMLEIVMRYSSHRSVLGNFERESRSLMLGSERALRQSRGIAWAQAALIVGVLFSLGILHLAIFWLRRREHVNLYFSGLCFSFIGYVSYSIQLWIPLWSHTTADHYSALEHLASFSSLAIGLFSSWFIHELFPAARLGRLVRWVSWYILVMFCFLVVAGLKTYWDNILWVSSVFLLFTWVVLVRLGRLSLRGEPFARLTLCAIGLFILTSSHDIARIYDLVDTPWLSQFGFLGMVVLQAYALAVRNAEAHQLAEKLSEDLQGEVEAQTHALQTQTVEAEHLRKLAEKQAVELREYDERKTRFFQNISHELRTPLTLMLHPLDAALKNHGDDEDLVVARRNCGRLLRLVNQLLDFQKLSVGTEELKLAPLDAVSFLRVSSDYFASSSAHRLLSFSVTIDGEPVSSTERRVGVVGELDALEKVIFNYLSNAMKFSPDGGAIELGIVVDPTLVRFFVRDTGPGIREEDQSKLFQIFSQLDDSSTRAYEGTGLGLALCRTLAAQMNGKVGVESTYGAGATFWLELERTAAETQILDDSFKPKDWLMDWTDNLPDPGGELEGSSGQEHVLVVDDLGDMRNLIGRILGERGYLVSYAGDGVAALELMEHGIPDLVITDWMMPRMDGLGLVQSLRTEPATEGLPVIMLTAKSDEGSKLEGLGGGADAFLGKPFSELELVSTVHNLMNLKANEKSLEAYSKRLEDALEALKVAELQKVESARLSTIGQLASGLAHELRNPLNVIQGVAETIMEEDDTSPRARLLTQASERADGVVERLIAVSETRSDETECRVGDALSSMSEIVMGDLDGSGISLEITGELDIRALIGRAELSQALVQLVQNAREASQEGGKIRIDIERESDELHIKIQDDGHGIDAKHQEQLFDAFFTTRLERNASGLGLTIAQRIVGGVDGTLSLVQLQGPTIFELKLKLSGMDASDA